MTDTPRTDCAENRWKESWSLRSGREEMAALARKFESQITHALRSIEKQIQANAASSEKTSNEKTAAWSAGVAEGLDMAAKFLTEAEGGE